MTVTFPLVFNKFVLWIQSLVIGNSDLSSRTDREERKYLLQINDVCKGKKGCNYTIENVPFPCNVDSGGVSMERLKVGSW